MAVALPSVTDYHDALVDHAAVKRFYERWNADPGFRQALLADAPGTLERYGMAVTAEDIASLLTPGAPPSAVSRAIWRTVREKSRWVERFYRDAAIPSDARMRAWRNRQIRRQTLDLGPFPTASNIHASWCVELSKGCTGGCWFCGVSAERLTGVFARDEAGAALWRGVLEQVSMRLGPAARSGFLYWATDPLDNPDYEALCLDMHEVIGVFPPTTTAFPLRDPARMRRLLALAQERDCWINRFSILTIGMLDKVHAEYSAEELALVECLPLNRESAFVFGNAGRFREKARKDPAYAEEQRGNLRWAPWYSGDPSYADAEDHPIGSIGCVTGFLVNMVDRRVQLISPTTSSDALPDGLIVFDDRRFEDAEGLGDVLEGMMARWMAPVLADHHRPRFHEWLTYAETDDGFTLTGRFRQVAPFVHPDRAAALRLLGSLVREGERTVADITAAVVAATGATEAETRSDLDAMLASGVLDELRVFAG
jgi:radical SAM family RiPP maturation amino acid epimerase